MTKEYSIRRQHGDGSQLQKHAPLDSQELSSYRHGHGHVSLPAVKTISSFVPNHRRQRNMTWNRTRWLFWRLAVALSMIAVAAGHSETAPVDLDLEEEFFYAVESSDQTFDYSSRHEKDRSLQSFEIPVFPTPPPFSFPPIPPIVVPTLPPFTNAPVPPIVVLFGKSSRAKIFDILSFECISVIR
jgi:hypothetical protein